MSGRSEACIHPSDRLLTTAAYALAPVATAKSKHDDPTQDPSRRHTGIEALAHLLCVPTMAHEAKVGEQAKAGVRGHSSPFTPGEP